jgi:hypothetical protein
LIPRPYRAAGRRRGDRRQRRRPGTRLRPRKRNRALVCWLRRIRHQRRERHGRGTPIRLHAHEPRAGVVFRPWLGGVETECAVVDVACRIGRGNAGDINIRIDDRERIDALDDVTIVAIDLQQCSSGCRHVDRAIRQHCVEDGLPSGGAVGRHRLPVTGRRPAIGERAVLPAQSVNAPDLRFPMLRRRVLAGFEFHENVIAVDERDLIVDDEAAARGGQLLRNEWVVGDVGQQMQQRLRRHRHAAGVFRIRADLRPLRAGR